MSEPHPRPLSESEMGERGENELSMKLPFHQDATAKIFENARFLKKVQTMLKPICGNDFEIGSYTDVNSDASIPLITTS